MASLPLEVAESRDGVLLARAKLRSWIHVENDTGRASEMLYIFEALGRTLEAFERLERAYGAHS